MSTPHIWPQVNLRRGERMSVCVSDNCAQGRADCPTPRACQYIRERRVQAAEACTELGAEDAPLPMRSVDWWMLAGCAGLVALWAVALVAMLRVWLS